MTRIAHVDRPSGARASLYPTVSELKPSLVFETSDHLLVAWGDCVMAMHVKEIPVTKKQPDVAGSSAAMTLPPTADVTVMKKRQVECLMAWELDCIASGVVPLDENHVIVLGLVPNEHDDDKPSNSNDVEVQVISRSEGTIVYADVLPVMKFSSQFSASSHGLVEESASPYRILSTFSLPRMEDSIEAEEEGTTVQPDFDFTLAFTQSKASFTDTHLKWTIDSLSFDLKKATKLEDNEDTAKNQKEDAKEEGEKGELIVEGSEEVGETTNENDADSVDSDDYGFLFRPSEADEAPLNNFATKSPPMMIIGSPADVLVAQVRNVDDAISHALSLQHRGRALERGIRHRRSLRNHDLDDLINEYLKAVLRIIPNQETTKKLSIRRLELAAKSTPILLGGNIQLWKQWIEEFGKIPGALFVLSGHVPVRGKTVLCSFLKIR